MQDKEIEPRRGDITDAGFMSPLRGLLSLSHISPSTNVLGYCYYAPSRGFLTFAFYLFPSAFSYIQSEGKDRCEFRAQVVRRVAWHTAKER
jgi:hypothetical protein